MSIDSRTTRLEQIVLDHEERLDSLSRLQERLVVVHEEQMRLNREIVQLLGSIDDRLGRLEDYWRTSH